MSHMAANASNFHSSEPLSDSPPIAVGNGALLSVTHHASIAIPTTIHLFISRTFWFPLLWSKFLFLLDL